MSKGRKESFVEHSIVEGYKKLSPKFFAVLEEMLNSEVKTDRYEGMKIIKGAMEKFLPTLLGSDEDTPLIVNIVKYGNANKAKSDTSSLQVSGEAISKAIA